MSVDILTLNPQNSTFLYRIAEATDWEQAQTTGFFASADLMAEGFIHSSTQSQILETARRYYAGRADLVLLEWDEDALTQAGVRTAREWVASRQEFFAHVFGAVPMSVVRRTWAFGADAAGAFALPPELR